MLRECRVVGAVLTGFGAAMWVNEFAVDGATFMILGAGMSILASRFADETRYLGLCDEAQRAWCGGENDIADCILVSIPMRARSGAVGAAVSAIAAIRANERTQYAAAKRHAEEALSPRRNFVQRVFRSYEAEPMAAAHAARAIAGAGLRDAETVREEEDWVKAHRDAPEGTRIAVARAAASLLSNASEEEFEPPTRRLIALPAAHDVARGKSFAIAGAFAFACLLVSAAQMVRSHGQDQTPVLACLAIAAAGVLLAGARVRLRGSFVTSA